MNFNYLGIKKLIATCYATSHIVYTQLSLFGDGEVVAIDDNGKKPYKVEITEVPDANGDGAIDLSDVEYLLKNNKNVLAELQGDGDFRSNECVELLKQADIVLTNPPFSLFREFLEILSTHGKDFIIIGNTNALTYREIFKMFKDDTVSEQATQTLMLECFLKCLSHMRNIQKLSTGKNLQGYLRPVGLPLCL